MYDTSPPQYKPEEILAHQRELMQLAATQSARLGSLLVEIAQSDTRTQEYLGTKQSLAMQFEQDYTGGGYLAVLRAAAQHPINVARQLQHESPDEL